LKIVIIAEITEDLQSNTGGRELAAVLKQQIVGWRPLALTFA
jgi:hypothetical protein